MREEWQVCSDETDLLFLTATRTWSETKAVALPNNARHAQETCAPFLKNCRYCTNSEYVFIEQKLP